jgi:hypothetical protein
MAVNKKPLVHVFLSYHVSEKRSAERVRRLLSNRSDVCVFDTQAISAGENWRSKILRALDEADVFIIIMSAKSGTSSWMLQELGAAWAKNLRIVPIFTDGHLELPFNLQGAQPLDLDDLAQPDSLNRIIEELKQAV